MFHNVEEILRLYHDQRIQRFLQLTGYRCTKTRLSIHLAIVSNSLIVDSSLSIFLHRCHLSLDSILHVWIVPSLVMRLSATFWLLDNCQVQEFRYYMLHYS